MNRTLAMSLKTKTRQAVLAQPWVWVYIIEILVLPIILGAVDRGA